MFRCLPLDPIVYQKVPSENPTGAPCKLETTQQTVKWCQRIPAPGAVVVNLWPPTHWLFFFNQGSNRNPNRNYLTWNHGIIRNGKFFCPFFGLPKGSLQRGLAHWCLTVRPRDPVLQVFALLRIGKGGALPSKTCLGIACSWCQSNDGYCFFFASGKASKASS